MSNHPLDCPICDQGGDVIYKIFRKFLGRSGKIREEDVRAAGGFRVVRW